MDDPKELTPAFHEEKITALARQENLSIMVIDSGLGGLSVYALIAEGLRGNHPFNEVTLTYYNAWPEQHRGYNNLPDTAERIRVFDRALLGVTAYRPDIILIACNTLSVLYPQTGFSQRTELPVIGIVPFGVDLIHEKMGSDPDSQVIIFGTLTTIAADVHRQALLARGIAGRRLAAQACDQLAGAIESDPHSARVRQMIADCVDRSAVNLPSGQGPVYAALCCTHYGYSAVYFQQTLARHPAVGAVGRTVGIIDPNQAMGDFLLSRFTGNAPDRSGGSFGLNLRVVSKITWSGDKLRVMAETVKPVSKAVAQALYGYHHNPELF